MKNKFYATAKELFENYMANNENLRSEKELIAAKLLLDFSKKFPAELSRAEVLKEQFMTKSSLFTIPSNFLKGFSPATKNAKSNSDLFLNDD